MQKNFVLDTNVLLHDPGALYAFEDNTVVLPIYVIEEIDKFKRDMNELSRSARGVSRMLDELRAQGNLAEGVDLPEGGHLRVAFSERRLPTAMTSVGHEVDSRIIAVALASVVAARLAVDVHRRLVIGLFDRRIEFEHARMLVVLARHRIELVELAQHDLAAIVLAHFHRIALQGGPGAVPRIPVHRIADFVAMLGVAAMFGLETRQHPFFIGNTVARADRP